MHRRSFKKHALQEVEVPLTPLIDCVFLLLLFFVLTTNFQPKQGNLEVQLPTVAKAQPSQGEQECLIEIDEKGYYRLGVVHIPTLVEVKQPLSHYCPDKSQGVALVGDEKAPHGATVRLLHLLRELQFQKINVRVQVE